MVVDGRKGDSILPYRRFMGTLHDDLVDALRVMENDGWHHEGMDDERWKCYNRVITWIDEVEARLRRWDNAKS